MYIAHNGKKSINMWLKSRTVVRKRQSPATADVSPPPKRANCTEAHIQKMDELQSITEKLKDMHKEGQYSHFSEAQFHVWGKTIQLGSHK